MIGGSEIALRFLAIVLPANEFKFIAIHEWLT